MKKEKKFEVDKHTPICGKHLEVTPKNGEDVGHMIKRFMRIVRDDGIMQEVGLRMAYVKPSDEKRRKRAKARAEARRNCEK